MEKIADFLMVDGMMPTRMLDFHTHLLPFMDDGSDSLQTSIDMLACSVTQGVVDLLVTPHFYATQMDLDCFLQTRAEVYQALQTKRCKQPTLQAVQLYLGAEVRYFHGMANSDRLDELCLQDTPYLLIEMPFERWTNSMFDELQRLIQRGIIPIIAHVERYFGMNDQSDSIDRLLKTGVYIQMNADAFLNRKTKKMACTMLQNGQVHALGSDCHNMTTRPPNLGEAVAAIKAAQNQHDRRQHCLNFFRKGRD